MFEWLKMRYVVYGVVFLLMAGGLWGAKWHFEREATEHSRLAEERFELAELEEKYSQFKTAQRRVGYETEENIQVMRDILEKRPERLDVRRTLFITQDQRRGHFEVEGSEMREILAEGLKYKDHYTSEEYQNWIRWVSSYSPGLVDAADPNEARKVAVDVDPYTDWAIEQQLGWASAKAKQGEEDALEYIEQTRKRVKEYAGREEVNPERMLTFLDYAEGLYWSETGQHERAIERVNFIYERLKNDSPKGPLPYELYFKADYVREKRRDILCRAGEIEARREEMIKSWKGFFGEDVSKWPDHHQKKYENPCEGRMSNE